MNTNFVSFFSLNTVGQNMGRFLLVNKKDQQKMKEWEGEKKRFGVCACLKERERMS